MTSANILKQEGNALFQQKKYTQSVAKYNEAIKLDPHNAIFYANRSAAYACLKHFVKASNDAQKSIELEPNYCKGYIRLAFSYQNMDRYHDAISQYKIAFNISPTAMSNKFIIEQIKFCVSKANIIINHQNDDDINKDNENTKIEKLKKFAKYIEAECINLFSDFLAMPLEDATFENFVTNIIEFVPVYNVIFNENINPEEATIFFSTEMYGMDQIEEYKQKLSKNNINSKKKKNNLRKNKNKKKNKKKKMSHNQSNFILHTTKTRKLFPKFTLNHKLKKMFVENKNIDEIFGIASSFEYDLNQFDIASELYRYLCNLNEIRSICNYALWYLVGNRSPIQQNLKMAYTLFEYATYLDANCGIALYNVGKFYYDGIIVHQDDKKAFDFIKKSIKDKRMRNELKNHQSYMLLSTMYVSGKGTNRNVKLAEKYYKIAQEIQYGSSYQEQDNELSKLYGLLSEMGGNQRETDLRWDTMCIYSKQYEEEKLDELEKTLKYRPERYICNVGEHVHIMKMCGFELYGYNENTMNDIKCENGMVEDFNGLGITYSIDPSFDWNHCEVKKVRLCGGCSQAIKGKIYLCRKCEQSYCSKKCQKQDWHSHKQQCDLISDVAGF